ncbi:MAG: hypothetical protein DRI26_00145 [Chloroflexi bacterium]|nr:MAG: hypothetical protein DRI26_00145 [Chloroflexota bacterium]
MVDWNMVREELIKELHKVVPRMAEKLVGALQKHITRLKEFDKELLDMMGDVFDDNEYFIMAVRDFMDDEYDEYLEALEDIAVIVEQAGKKALKRVIKAMKEGRG